MRIIANEERNLLKPEIRGIACKGEANLPASHFNNGLDKTEFQILNGKNIH